VRSFLYEEIDGDGDWVCGGTMTMTMMMMMMMMMRRRRRRRRTMTMTMMMTMSTHYIFLETTVATKALKRNSWSKDDMPF